MGKALRAALSLLVLFLASGASLAQPRLFSIPGHGGLQLAVPAGWRVAEKPPLADPPAAAILMAPASGDAFNLQITVLWLDPAKRAQTTPQMMKERVQGLAKKMMPGAAESSAEVLELRGASTLGYYFSLTDRASKNAGGDYKYATQGIALSGEMMSIFTLLHRDAAVPEKGQMLRMLAEANHVKGAPGAAVTRQDALVISESPQAFELAVPISRLVMTIPKGNTGLTSIGEVSGRGHPRYFNFAGSLNVSGWFEQAQNFKGMQAFWAGETAEWKKRGLPSALNVTFTKIGNWDAVIYELELAGMQATNTHVRAHWVQAGTWIDLHASVASRATTAETRSQLTKFVETIQVREKDK